MGIPQCQWRPSLQVSAGQAKWVYLKVNGDLASKATVTMLLGNLPANAAQSGSVCVHNLELPVHFALILDGLLDLGICQNLIIQTSSIAVHLLHNTGSVKTTAHRMHCCVLCICHRALFASCEWCVLPAAMCMRLHAC